MKSASAGPPAPASQPEVAPYDYVKRIQLEMVTLTNEFGKGTAWELWIVRGSGLTIFIENPIPVFHVLLCILSITQL